MEGEAADGGADVQRGERRGLRLREAGGAGRKVGLKGIAEVGKDERADE